MTLSTESQYSNTQHTSQITPLARRPSPLRRPTLQALHWLEIMCGASRQIPPLITSRLSKDSRTGYDAAVSGYGIFLKPKMALTDSTEIFARVGAMRSKITAATGGAHTGNDVAYGLGIQTNFTKTVYGQLDYMQSYDRDSVAAKGYTLSLGTRF